MARGVLPTLWAYFEVTKPRLTGLLVFTALGAMFLAARPNPLLTLAALWAPAMAAITAGSAGCNVVTSYIDRDIDSVMHRTLKRPLPSGRITPPERALYFGLALLGVALILSWARNPLAFLWILLGILDNVVVYSLLLKRRSSLNIILGGVSGGLPVLFGWSYVTGGIELAPVLLGGLVFLWIPNHIWTLALYAREDYAKAGVPMLPVKIGARKALNCIVATTPILVFFSILVYFLAGLGWIYLLSSVGGGVAILGGSLYLLFKPDPKVAWRLFKLSSPYLFVLFLAIIIESSL